MLSGKRWWRGVSAGVLGGMLLAGGACHRAERAAEETARVAEEQARAVLIDRDEKQLSAAFRKLQDVAARADATTLYRVANQFDEDYAAVATSGRRKVAGYPIRHQVEVTRREAQSLVAVLTDRKTYFPPGDGWTCIFEPHDVLSVAAGKEMVTVVVCTQCGDVELIVGGESIGTHSVLPGKDAEISRMLKDMLSESTPAGSPASDTR
jgi:hypothetical protein